MFLHFGTDECGQIVLFIFFLLPKVLYLRLLFRTMGMGRNPQFWGSNGAQPEIQQETRNHAHDFKFPENLKIWSHGGPR